MTEVVNLGSNPPGKVYIARSLTKKGKPTWLVVARLQDGPVVHAKCISFEDAKAAVEHLKGKDSE